MYGLYSISCKTLWKHFENQVLTRVFVKLLREHFNKRVVFKIHRVFQGFYENLTWAPWKSIALSHQLLNILRLSQSEVSEGFCKKSMKTLWKYVFFQRVCHKKLGFYNVCKNPMKTNWEQGFYMGFYENHRVFTRIFMKPYNFLKYL